MIKIKRKVGNKNFVALPEKGTVKGSVPKKDIYDETATSGLSEDMQMLIWMADFQSGEDKKHTYKCTAKCDPRDEFDVEKGFDLVGEKLDRKNHWRLAKKFARMYLALSKCADYCDERFKYHIGKIEKIDKDILNTYGTEGE